MFGLFSRDRDTQVEFNALQKYLTQEWRMKPRYVAAFLNAYRADISEKFRAGQLRQQALESSSDASDRLQAAAYDTAHFDIAIVAQAYQGYLRDLRQGKHVNTDIEIAIWAVLVNRSDILESVDSALADFTFQNYEKKFPGLLVQAFEQDSIE